MKLIYLGLLLFCSNLWSQSSFVSLGGTTTDGKSSVSYSVGQVYYHSYRDGPQLIEVNEGVQFAQKLIVQEIGTKEKDSNELLPPNQSSIEDYNVRVYPNPVSSFLNIEIEGDSELEYQLTDLQGRLISTKRKLNYRTQVDFSVYENDLYILTIFESGTPVKNYKIFKHKN